MAPAVTESRPGKCTYSAGSPSLRYPPSGYSNVERRWNGGSQPGSCSSLGAPWVGHDVPKESVRAPLLLVGTAWAPRVLSNRGPPPTPFRRSGSDPPDSHQTPETAMATINSTALVFPAALPSKRQATRYATTLRLLLQDTTSCSVALSFPCLTYTHGSGPRPACSQEPHPRPPSPAHPCPPIDRCLYHIDP